ncbi:MAG: MarR family transcriptional regulator [Anaerolineae bacterium]|nr:MarR family transcriptional regulator [Anaerolineae bacterium]
MITDQKQQLVEEFGIYFERAGLQRMAGRIIGWLLICDPPHQSMQDLCDALQASKSAVSVATRQLISLYLIERMSLPGERRDYFRASSDMWNRSFRARIHQLTELRELAERGLRLLENESEGEQFKRLELMRDANRFLEREFIKLLDQWDEEKKRLGYGGDTP